MSRTGRIIIWVLSAVVFGATASVATAAGPGELDAEFSGDGVAFARFGRAAQTSTAGIDSRGRLTVVGYTLSSPLRTVMTRFLANGDLDPAFGQGGKRQFADGSAAASAYAWAVDSSGAWLGVGEDEGGYYVVKVTAAGRLDRAFGRDGIVRTGAQGFIPTAVLVTQTGNVVVAGLVGSDTVLHRYEPNGDRDASFGHGGVARLSGESWSMAMDGDERLLVAGARQNRRLVVDAFTAGGERDLAFGQNGRARLTIPLEIDELRSPSIEVTGEGAIVLAADARFGLSGSDVIVGALGRDGRPNAAFGDGGGWAAFDIGPFDFVGDVAVLPSGRIVVCGKILTDLFSGDVDMFLLGVTESGGKWRAFADRGSLRTDFGRNGVDANAIVLAGGKLLVAGNASGRILAARFLLN